jgi:hypothetical protein
MTEPPKMITLPGDAKFSFYASRKGATVMPHAKSAKDAT